MKRIVIQNVDPDKFIEVDYTDTSIIGVENHNDLKRLLFPAFNDTLAFRSFDSRIANRKFNTVNSAINSAIKAAWNSNRTVYSFDTLKEAFIWMSRKSKK